MFWGLSVWALLQVLFLPPHRFVWTIWTLQRCLLDGVSGWCSPHSDHLGGRESSSSGWSQLLFEVGGAGELSWLSYRHAGSLGNIYGIPLITFKHLQRVLISAFSVSTYTPFEFSVITPSAWLRSFPLGHHSHLVPFSATWLELPPHLHPPFALILHLPEPSWWMRLLPEDAERERERERENQEDAGVKWANSES